MYINRCANLGFLWAYLFNLLFLIVYIFYLVYLRLFALFD